ncbi:conjugal transfer protein TraO [Dysgonomonas mossii]|nr:conjugal transfer protein TraO [Dysgonomonas mossii]
MFGAESLERYYPYREKQLQIAQFSTEGGYYYNFLPDSTIR